MYVRTYIYIENVRVISSSAFSVPFDLSHIRIEPFKARRSWILRGSVPGAGLLRPPSSAWQLGDLGQLRSAASLSRRDGAYSFGGIGRHGSLARLHNPLAPQKGLPYCVCSRMIRHLQGAAPRLVPLLLMPTRKPKERRENDQDWGSTCLFTCNPFMFIHTDNCLLYS